MISLLCVLSSLSPAALAYNSGRTGSSTSGCGSCHGSSASSATTVSISTDSTVYPGDTVTVTVTVANSSMAEAGLNVSATGGSFTAGSGTRVSGGELTHSAPASLSGGSRTFSFDWTAPSAEASYTLYVAGNAVNGNGRSSGDAWNLDSFSVSVDDGCDDDDGDGVTTCGDDCDDGDSTVYPGADELCDDIDNDCDDVVDEDPIDPGTFYVDGDGDGYGDSSTEPVVACDQPDGYTDDIGDCDDRDAAYSPGAVEDDCTDPNDYNCDGSVGFADLDGDGYAACEECDDTTSAVNPAATEVCDGVDNNCDGLTDDDDPGLDDPDAPTFYRDADGDSYGDEADAVVACLAPDGYVDSSDDCDDSDAGVSPGAAEIPGDSIDQDCDGVDAEVVPDPSPGDTGAAGEAPDDTDDDDGTDKGGCSTLGGSAGLGVWGLAALAGVRRRRRAAQRYDRA